ncbi:MAG: electron transfer flavoprotein subunit alpha [Thermodesulfobacteriota bacterium]
MEKILFLAHVEVDGSLAKSHLEALSGAKVLADGLAAELCVGLVGADCAAAANQIAGCGAARFYAVSGPEFASSRYATDCAALTALAKAAGATVVVAAATSRLSRALPGVAHRLGGKVDTQATGLAAEGGAVAISRWYYRQRMVASMTRTQRPWVLSVAPCCFLPWEGAAGAASVEAVAADAASRTTVKGLEQPSADQQTIRPEAELLFVAGAGWMKKQADGATHVKEAEGLIKTLLDGTKASLGSSKSLVDVTGEGGEVISFLSHLHQVGQTGSTPRHKKGLATCCHGEEPHVVGWRFINERRAVNLDAACGWAQGKADVLYVADAFAVVKKLNELLGK